MKFFAALLVALMSAHSSSPAEARDEFGLTALHYAAQKKDLSVLKGLLSEGRDPNARGSTGWTPLFSAVTVSNTEAAVILLDAGADVNARADNGNRPIHHASDSIAPLLLSRGAMVEAQNERGWTPLHSAAFFGRVETVRLLLTAGASRDAKNVDGRSAIELAREKKHTAIIALLDPKTK